MEILLTEFDSAEKKTLAQSIVDWGLVVSKQDSAGPLIEILRRHPEIQIVIVGEDSEKIRQQIPEVRKLKQFVNIVAFINEDESNKNVIVSGEHKVYDQVIFKTPELDKLRYYIHGARHAIAYSYSYFLADSLTSIRYDRQCINLDQFGALAPSNRLALEVEFKNLLEVLKQFHLDEETLGENTLDDILALSEKLKTDQLTDWIVGTKFLRHNPALLDFLNHNILNHQLIELQTRISVALTSLKMFGFFDKNDSGSESATVLKGKKVLLVEDMKYNRVLLKKILMKQECNIVEAVDGKDALEKWQSTEDFDIIIMDMNMPVMDGFEATKEIRKLETQNGRIRIPIIALTALAMRGDRELCLEAGTDDYLPKPVEAIPLVKACENLIDNETPQKVTKHDTFNDLRSIERILVKVTNQVSLFALRSILRDLGIEFEISDSVSEVVDAVAERDFSLIVLEADIDLELGYFIKNNFPHQNIALISSQNSLKELISKNFANNFQYPLQSGQVITVLKYYNDKLQQAQKDAEKLADVDSLDRIKRQTGISEAVQKSSSQLAVWQKAFRKIGGDLILAHQFNLHGKFGLVLGDVAGHDIQSGYTASWFSGLVEGIWGQNTNPFNFLINLNNLFAHDTEEENKRFVCALVLLWDPVRKTLSYANAGIPGGIMIKKDSGKGIHMDWTGIPIGMFPDMDMYDHGELDFQDGDRLIIATDGVLEAIPREIISDLSESRGQESSQKTLDAIVDFVTRSIEITDDLTIAVFEGKLPKEPDIGYRQTIKSDFREVDDAVGKMGEFIDEHAKGIFDWSMVSVAIREGLLNAVEHGNKSDASLPVDIDFELEDDQLIVTISDCGSGFDLPTEKKRLEQEGDLRIHGRGIEMMENICHSVSFQGGGIRLVFDPMTADLNDT